MFGAWRVHSRRERLPQSFRVGTLQDLTGMVFEYEPGAESVIPTNSGKELVEVSIGWRFQRLDERGVEISEGSGRAEEESFRRFTKRRMALEMVPGVWLQERLSQRVNAPGRQRCAAG